jgi:hypothetical protein
MRCPGNELMNMSEQVHQSVNSQKPLKIKKKLKVGNVSPAIDVILVQS